VLTLSLACLAVVDDKSFLEKLVAADGNPREFARVMTKTAAL